MRYKLLTVDTKNMNGRIYPLKEIEKMIEITDLVPVTIGLPDRPTASGDPNSEAWAGTFSDFKLEGNVLTGKLTKAESPVGKTLGILESESDFVVCGTGLIDEQTGVISKWTFLSVSAVTKVI